MDHTDSVPFYAKMNNNQRQNGVHVKILTGWGSHFLLSKALEITGHFWGRLMQVIVLKDILLTLFMNNLSLSGSQCRQLSSGSDCIVL